MLALIVFVFLAIQVMGPERPVPGVSEYGKMARHIVTPRAIEAILEDACYDCHSAWTDWPWYSEIAPISWLIRGHVRHGRSNLDFSNWSTDPGKEPTPRQRLRWICEEAREDVMPPLSYRLLHREARLTTVEKDRLCEWVAEALEELRLGPASTSGRSTPDSATPAGSPGIIRNIQAQDGIPRPHPYAIVASTECDQSVPAPPLPGFSSVRIRQQWVVCELYRREVVGAAVQFQDMHVHVFRLVPVWIGSRANRTE
jgi:hypothetical protein